MRIRLFAAVLISLVLPVIGSATTWEIYPDGSGDAPTIQAGIDGAATGDSILINAGTYYERLTLPVDRDEFTLVGVGLPVIDADRFGFILGLSQEGTVFENLAFTQGHTYIGGVGTLSSREIWFRNCEFYNNTANLEGGCFAILNGGIAHFENCSFENNLAWGTGGGAIQVDEGGSIELEHCVFRGNHVVGITGNDGGGAIHFRNTSSCSIRFCLFEENTTDYEAGAIRSYNSPVSLYSNTFLDNEARTAAGACVLNTSGPQVVLMKNIFVNNRDPVKAIYLEGSDLLFDIECNDFWNHVESTVISPAWIDTNGNFSLNPLFCDPDNGDFTLHADSPCVPGNHPDGYECGLIGAYDVGCGMAGVPNAMVQNTTWGQIKATYR
ncbi:MAG: right-handed parallel beta-helix repeat-containing protein [Candidatus Eisenbacteria bacterium]|uniref:Right-handed parallel beta-helix repeat-containing protein n=1 Tax=Eiseniibacteriota bacterium TaxID=2212470 RepID=A0A948RUJ2_UNCEI|nr:right-handed parallel beta-helix repeat-containing protein [Candidatus Eisenbacteria bacterium]MBU1950216.1 right-handed parallel beta-helix repeat-containing protein [Candidatus Eisenbacteria bacterium]MBU2690241.1 right-handed parallel beta-helix repeat-containing protein [Candidatus Eisenbacteria bacterium]